MCHDRNVLLNRVESENVVLLLLCGAKIRERGRGRGLERGGGKEIGREKGRETGREGEKERGKERCQDAGISVLLVLSYPLFSLFLSTHKVHFFFSLSFSPLPSRSPFLHTPTLSPFFPLSSSIQLAILVFSPLKKIIFHFPR